VTRDIFRFTFRPEVTKSDVEASLALAFIAVEGLYGESQTRLEAGHAIGNPFSACVIDGTTCVGHDLAKVFIAFLRQELGEDSFKVERLPPRQSEPRASTSCAL